MFSGKKHVIRVVCIVMTMVILGLTGTPVMAEVKEVRLAKQYGLPYLPLIIMEENKLIEKHAKAAGLGDVKVIWATLGSGAAMNDALLSGSVDFISGGVAPLITIWAKTKGEVRGVAPLDTTPIYFNSSNPSVKSVRDLTDKDRIALPAVKVSIQAVILQMAAAQAFGENNHEILDRLTVSMKHPDAVAALLSGKSEITGHLTVPPFNTQELKDPRVHKVLDSYEVLGGAHSLNAVSSTKRFYDNNPRTYAAVFAALEEAIAFIKKDKRTAAQLYIRASKSKESVNEVLALLKNPSVNYTSTPLNTTKFAEFMYRTGAIKIKPNGWKELFFPNLHSKKGS